MALRATPSAGHDKIDGLRSLALLVGLDIKTDALAFLQRLQPGALDRGDVYEDVATAVVRFDEAVAALTVEELDRTGHCHRETPSPVVAPPRAPTADGSAGHSGESVGRVRPRSFLRPPRKETERQSPKQTLPYVASLKRGHE